MTRSPMIATNKTSASNSAPPPPWLQEIEEMEESVNKDLTANANPQNNAVDPSIPRFILYTRIINLALSVCMILISALAILTTQTATTGVLACYVMVFSCLICCFEAHLKSVAKIIALNFGFMYSAKARIVFMILVGTEYS